VVILPLLRNGGLAGLLEVFSSRARAFGERDEVTLEALAQRILKNLTRASETLSMASIIAAGGVQIPVAKPAPIVASSEPSRADSAAGLNQEDDVTAEIHGRSPRTGLDVVTFALGAAVVLCAVLLATLVGLRLNARRTAGVRGQVTKPPSGAAAAERNGAAQDGAVQIAGGLGSNAVSPSASSKTGKSMVAVGEKKGASAPATVAEHPIDPLPPEGGLLVYENGKEVFRMPPSVHGDASNTANENGSGMQRASAVESAGVVEISPEAAEGSLLHRVEPEYPEEARRQRMQGAVVLDVRIGRDGAVQDVKLVNGQQLLAGAAIAAVKQWRFKPQMRKGQAVEMQTRVTLYFRMPV
jgi:TonB family protein